MWLSKAVIGPYVLLLGVAGAEGKLRIATAAVTAFGMAVNLIAMSYMNGLRDAILEASKSSDEVVRLPSRLFSYFPIRGMLALHAVVFAYASVSGSMADLLGWACFVIWLLCHYAMTLEPPKKSLPQLLRKLIAGFRSPALAPA